MDERRQILYMQVRIIRLAAERLHATMKFVAELFEKYGVLKYIEIGFGIFHVEGDEAILSDVFAFLRRKGVNLDAELG